MLCMVGLNSISIQSRLKYVGCKWVNALECTDWEFDDRKRVHGYKEHLGIIYSYTIVFSNYRNVMFLITWFPASATIKFV